MEQEKSSSPVLYRVGTLTYTRLQLIAVCAWMLYGIFCFCLMEALVPSLLPLSLKRFDASNTMIGILVGSIPGVTGPEPESAGGCPICCLPHRS